MGQGNSYKCEKCDYTLEYMQGIGFLYPIEADKMLTEMQGSTRHRRYAALGLNY